MLLSYYGSHKLLAKKSGISYKTFLKVVKGNTTVTLVVYRRVYEALAIHHKYDKERVIYEIRECEIAGL
jgi:hypothetical protein